MNFNKLLQGVGLAALTTLIVLSLQSSIDVGSSDSHTVKVGDTQPFIGEITLFGGNFAPRGYAFCHGQLLPINGNEALFSIIGTIYGGDGRTTFALPDLRGRTAIQEGQGPGFSNIRLGAKGGSDNVGVNLERGSFFPGASGSQINVVTDISVENRNPYLGTNFIIALQGIFPSRN